MHSLVALSARSRFGGRVWPHGLDRAPSDSGNEPESGGALTVGYCRWHRSICRQSQCLGWEAANGAYAREASDE